MSPTRDRDGSLMRSAFRGSARQRFYAVGQGRRWQPSIAPWRVRCRLLTKGELADNCENSWDIKTPEVNCCRSSVEW